MQEDQPERQNQQNTVEREQFKRLLTLILIILFQIAFTLSIGLKNWLSVQADLTEEDTVLPWFQDSTFFVLIGFGFFMTVFNNYSMVALTYTLFIFVFGFQAFIIFDGMVWKPIFNMNPGLQLNQFSSQYFNQAIYAIMAIVIGYGAMLGRVGSFQIFIFTILGIFGYTLCQTILRVFTNPIFFDGGGSTFVNCFGAYYGLTVNRIIFTKKEQIKKPTSPYLQNIFGMIGVLFLWVFWPSFNVGFTFNRQIYSLTSLEQQKTFIYLNTRLALCASCISAFIFSILLSKGQKIDIRDIMYGSLAGGVIIGASSNLLGARMGLGISLILGFIGGFTTILCMNKLQPCLEETCTIYDTRGVQSLHGIPGLIGGLTSAIVVAIYQREMIPSQHVGLHFFQKYKDMLPNLAGIQVAGTMITLGMAILTGLSVGFLLKLLYHLKVVYKLTPKQQFQNYDYEDISSEKKQETNLERLGRELKDLD